MPLPMGLARETTRFQTNHAERRLIEAKAREAGKNVGNYVRAALGLPEHVAGRPSVEQLEAEQDQAWEILRNLWPEPGWLLPFRRLVVGGLPLILVPRPRKARSPNS